jgi:hypothetical protein
MLGSTEGKSRIVSEGRKRKAVGQTVRTEWHRMGYQTQGLGIKGCK